MKSMRTTPRQFSFLCLIPQEAAAMGMSMSELFDLIIEETSQAQP